jgi:hypothetical protein
VIISQDIGGNSTKATPSDNGCSPDSHVAPPGDQR